MLSSLDVTGTKRTSAGKHRRASHDWLWLYLPIGWECDTRFFSQSQTIAMENKAITRSLATHNWKYLNEPISQSNELLHARIKLVFPLDRSRKYRAALLQTQSNPVITFNVNFLGHFDTQQTKTGCDFYSLCSKFLLRRQHFSEFVHRPPVHLLYVSESWIKFTFT